MAKKVIKPKVGMHVYMPYSTNKPGKIKKVLPKAIKWNMKVTEVEVMWIDGSTSTEVAFKLSNFDSLISDHQKKLNTHTSKLPKLKKL